MGKLFFPDADIEREVVEAGKVTRKVRANGEKLMIVEVSFASGGVGAEHEHPHDQATYCLAGEFSFSVGGETWIVRTGDSVFIPGGSRHGTVCLSEGRLLDVFTPRREDFLKRKE